MYRSASPDPEIRETLDWCERLATTQLELIRLLSMYFPSPSLEALHNQSVGLHANITKHPYITKKTAKRNMARLKGLEYHIAKLQTQLKVAQLNGSNSEIEQTHKTIRKAQQEYDQLKGGSRPPFEPRGTQF